MDKSVELINAEQQLEKLQSAYLNSIQARSWETRDGQSSRSVTNQDPEQIMSQINKVKKEIARLSGRGSRAFVMRQSL